MKSYLKVGIHYTLGVVLSAIVLWAVTGALDIALDIRHVRTGGTEVNGNIVWLHHVPYICFGGVATWLFNLLRRM